MDIEQIVLTLENERKFHDDYHACRNRETGEGGQAGSSVGVQRRSVIGRHLGIIGARVRMLGMIEIERYFNERYELCPYGLKSSIAWAKSEAKTKTAVPTEEDEMENTNAKAAGESGSTHGKPVIEQVVLIYGQDARKISDEQMYGYIAALEAKMNQLLSLKNKPNKLLAQVEAMQKEIDMLIAVVDSRP